MRPPTPPQPVGFDVPEGPMGEGGLRFADALPLQVWTARPDGALEFVNRYALDYFGRAADQAIGADWRDALHPDDRADALARWDRSLRTGESYQAVVRLRRADGAYRWHIGHALPVHDAGRRIVQWFGTHTDIDDQLRTEEALAESERRSAFLSAASRDLAETLDYEATLRNVARLAVPEFADWCAVDLVGPDGSLRRVAVEHPDPAKVEFAHHLQERYPPDPESPHGVYHVLRTGLSELVPHIPDELLVAATRDEEHLRLIRELRLRSYVVAPLRTRRGILGAMTFVYAESDRAYERADLEFVEELARRAATAIENAQLVAGLEHARRELEEQASELEMQAEELRLQAVQLEEQAEELAAANADLQVTADRLARSEALLAEAQAMAHVGSWEWDVLSDTITWTDELYRLFGLEPGAGPVAFETYLERIHPDDRERVEAVVAAAIRDYRPFSFEHRLIRPDGELRHIQSRGRVVVRDGRPIRMTGSAQDVTERKAAEEATERAREEAERANRAKSEFLAAMSHELRTPLNAIAGHVDLVLLGIHGPITDEQRAALERVKANQHHLLALINDILQFAKVEAGRLEYRIEPVPVAEAVRGVIDMLEPQARAHGLACEYHPPDRPLLAAADRDRLQQILINLLSNAIKFSDAGGRISLSCGRADDAVLVRVADTGRGIPPEKLRSIFDPFVQLGPTRDEHRHGVGLGLAISRDLARGMDGDIMVESEPGRGSTFTLRLPSARGEG